jgi:ElaA protein
MIKELQKKNTDIKIYSVADNEFNTFGRVINDIDTTEIINAAGLFDIPEGISYDEMSIGRVVVKKTHRGQGISKIMMKKAIEHIVNDFNKSKIRLSGQAYLEKFYTDLGFEKVSDCYLEDGIDHFEFLFEK